MFNVIHQCLLWAASFCFLKITRIVAEYELLLIHLQSK